MGRERRPGWEGKRNGRKMGKEKGGERRGTEELKWRKGRADFGWPSKAR